MGSVKYEMKLWSIGDETILARLLVCAYHPLVRWNIQQRRQYYVACQMIFIDITISLQSCRTSLRYFFINRFIIPSTRWFQRRAAFFCMRLFFIGFEKIDQYMTRLRLFAREKSKINNFAWSDVTFKVVDEIKTPFNTFEILDVCLRLCWDKTNDLHRIKITTKNAFARGSIGNVFNGTFLRYFLSIDKIQLRETIITLLTTVRIYRLLRAIILHLFVIAISP